MQPLTSIATFVSPFATVGQYDASTPTLVHLCSVGQLTFQTRVEQFVDEFSFPANPSASHVTIAAGIPGRDAASKSEEQGGHSRRKPGLVGAVDALLVRVLNRLEQRPRDRRQD